MTFLFRPTKMVTQPDMCPLKRPCHANYRLFLKAKTCFRINMNSKHNGTVFVFNTTFRHGNCFLSSFAMDDKDGRGLKF